jgi:hypothetical protein
LDLRSGGGTAGRDTAPIVSLETASANTWPNTPEAGRTCFIIQYSNQVLQFAVMCSAGRGPGKKRTFLPAGAEANLIRGVGFAAVATYLARNRPHGREACGTYREA